MEHLLINGTDNLFVLFHGTGGNESNLLFLTGELDSHASVISFLGNVGTGKNRRFFNPLVNGKVDKKDYSERIDEFLKNWDSMDISKYKNITFIGYSNGANFTLGLLEKRPDIANTTILLHPSNFDWQFTKKPEKNKIIATTGALDLMAPAADVVKLKNQLLNIGYDNFEIILLDSGHELTEIEVEKLKEIYKK
ncbi:alpha/beta hydrolase [Leptotrichia sp. oral taxon 223]|uniref:alpha/beta hydrolase n=1 Tax=Leptotrichia sp. oral taxon 223 TaxID=712363 RepID=UPI0015BE3E29|nr:phospholipase [Leptotrichia sp. oral taxon 223]NWO19658.1 phospholipase [Leptotrichia sp. oral taxon 223]